MLVPRGDVRAQITALVQRGLMVKALLRMSFLLQLQPNLFSVWSYWLDFSLCPLSIFPVTLSTGGSRTLSGTYRAGSQPNLGWLSSRQVYCPKSQLLEI